MLPENESSSDGRALLPQLGLEASQGQLTAGSNPPWITEPLNGLGWKEHQVQPQPNPAMPTNHVPYATSTF